ncbi:MAG: hypothetical protein GX278_02560 [Aeromonadales bacterium]|nr:hypothetical protein [Aeromonadales bacterium]
MIIDLKNMATFGVAGNFTGHLEQAGEATDFTNVKTAEAKAPKAVFPTFIKGAKTVTPEFLGIYPFDSKKIIFPKGESKLQIEPECAIICDVTWENGKVSALKPTYFGASNDCSIRKEGAKKISEKKNWGVSSKGFSDNAIKIDSFDENGILNKYRIASFLVRDGVVHPYGEDSAVRDYSYIYAKLIAWLIEKFNNQQNEGPAEMINSYLNEAGCPEQIMVSIGATRYTDFGEHNFLQNNDESVVVVYPEDKYSKEDIIKGVENNSLNSPEVSVLSQRVEV